jgi:hypothetical protein
MINAPQPPPPQKETTEINLNVIKVHDFSHLPY